MPKWIKYGVLGAVVGTWVGYVVVTLIEKQGIPLPVWTVPGATWAVLDKTRDKEGARNEAGPIRD